MEVLEAGFLFLSSFAIRFTQDFVSNNNYFVHILSVLLILLVRIWKCLDSIAKFRWVFLISLTTNHLHLLNL